MLQRLAVLFVMVLCVPVAYAQRLAADEPLRLGEPAPPTPDVQPELSPEATPPPVVSHWAGQPIPGAESAASFDPNGSPTDVISGDGAGDVMQVGGGIAGVLLLIFLLRSLVRRVNGATSSGNSGGRSLMGGKAPSGVAAVLARYPVARGQQVVLLEVGRRVLVVHQTASTMKTLSEITDTEELADLRIRLAGDERVARDAAFSTELKRSLEHPNQTASHDPVAQLDLVDGGMVAETIDLTRRSKAQAVVGGAA